jgi:serine phosphatase RsbU (regulator of sigma subunit)
MSKLWIVILFCVFSFVGFADRYQDSLRDLISSAPNDSAKIVAYTVLGHALSGEPVKAAELLLEWESYNKNLTDDYLKAFSLRKMGIIYARINNYDKALEYTLNSARIFEKMGDKAGLANCYNNIASAYNEKGDLTHDKMYFDKSIEYHLKALELRRQGPDTSEVKNSYNNIGTAYLSMGQYEKALEYLNKAYIAYKGINDNNGFDMIVGNLGDGYLEKGRKTRSPEDFRKALVYFKDRLDNYKDHGANDRYTHVLERVGEVYCELGKYDEAIEYLKMAEAMSIEIKDQGTLLDVSEYMAKALEAKGEYKKAVEYMHQYAALKDSLVNEKNASNMGQMLVLFQTSQKDQEIQGLNHDKEIQAAELSRNRILIFSVVGGLLLVLLMAFLLYSRYALKKKANLKLTEAYDKIELKNRQITDSITYARRIQTAILPPKEIISPYLNNFFVYYSPRDIVSGDFYWFSRHKGKLFFIVADCTGHGVPGALMSMIGNTLLNEIINQKNILDPGEILNLLNKGVNHSLRQQGNDILTQDDGMDVSVCCLDESDKLTLKHACANHTIFIKSKDGIRSLKGDIFSVGGSLGQSDRTFTTNETKLSPGDHVIMSTDGFYDQFGGPENRKFLISRFESLLQNSVNGQSEKHISKAFEDWKGKHKQTDDVLVAGFEV